MQKQIFGFILLSILSNFSLQSCRKKENQTQNENLTKEKSNEKKDSTKFKSLLRPNENLSLGKIYTDNVEFIRFDDNGDDFYFIVRKNKDTIGLIYNKDNPQISTGSALEIQWKMDSLRPAGDPEYLDFTEYLVSWKTIKSSNNQEKYLSKLKDQSFVISCGTGCAMTHNVKNTTQINPKAIKVTFEVVNYIDQELSETYDDIFTFFYDNQNKLKKVTREGETENILDNFMGGAKQSFEEFGAKLIEQNNN